MDVCPVGAITTRDYRFKSRPWDNPNAADTICTLCSKGCNTTAWIKAKPEWAKGSRLIRFTPRFNPDVNSYWMCDIGRFDYHWIESDDRLRRPLMRGAGGLQQPCAWHEVMPKLTARFAPAGRANPMACASCCLRTLRTRSCSVPPAHRGTARRRAAATRSPVSWRMTAKAAAAANQIHGAGRGCAQRERRADLRSGERPERRSADGAADISGTACGG